MLLSPDRVALDRNSYNCGLHRFCGNDFFPEHSHGFYEYFLVVSGTLLHGWNGKERILHPRTLQLLAPGDTHSLRCADSGGQTEIYNMNVTSAEFLKCLYFVSGSGASQLPDEVTTVPEIPSAFWNSLILKAVRITSCGRNAPDLELKNSLCRVLTQELLFFLMERSRRGARPELPWLDQAVQEMRKRENFLLGLPRFVTLSGRSAEHLCRSMRQYYGMSPREWILKQRLEYAASRLEYGSSSVTDVAYDSGFRNLSYFRRCFQEKFGVAPLTWRNQVRKGREG